MTSFERVKSLAEDPSFYTCIRRCISQGDACTRMGLYVHAYTHHFLEPPPSVKFSQILTNIQQRWISPSPQHFKKKYVVKFTFMLMNAEWFSFELHFTSKESAAWRRGDWGKSSAVYSFLMGERGGADTDLFMVTSDRIPGNNMKMFQEKFRLDIRKCTGQHSQAHSVVLEALLSRAQSWTQLSLWFPSNSGYSVILCFCDLQKTHFPFFSHLFSSSTAEGTCTP